MLSYMYVKYIIIVWLWSGIYIQKLQIKLS